MTAKRQIRVNVSDVVYNLGQVAHQRPDHPLGIDARLLAQRLNRASCTWFETNADGTYIQHPKNSADLVPAMEAGVKFLRSCTDWRP
jgi:hypothetical protein